MLVNVVEFLQRHDSEIQSPLSTTELYQLAAGNKIEIIKPFIENYLLKLNNLNQKIIIAYTK